MSFGEEQRERLRLDMLKLEQEQRKLQREIMDRWFRYYLLIIGSPVPILGVLVQIRSIRESIAIYPGYIAVIVLFLFIVGLMFLLMHIRQRINVLRFLQKISSMERLMFEELFPELKESYCKLRPNRFGADFYIGLVYIFINSVWFAAFIYLLGCDFAEFTSGYAWTLAGLGLVVIIVLQFILRFLMLQKYEMARDNG